MRTLLANRAIGAELTAQIMQQVAASKDVVAKAALFLQQLATRRDIGVELTALIQQQTTTNQFVTASTRLNDLEIDCPTLLNAVEQAFDLRFSYAEAGRIKTVADIIAVIGLREISD